MCWESAASVTDLPASVTDLPASVTDLAASVPNLPASVGKAALVDLERDRECLTELGGLRIILDRSREISNNLALLDLTSENNLGMKYNSFNRTDNYASKRLQLRQI